MKVAYLIGAAAALALPITLASGRQPPSAPAPELAPVRVIALDPPPAKKADRLPLVPETPLAEALAQKAAAMLVSSGVPAAAARSRHARRLRQGGPSRR